MKQLLVGGPQRSGTTALAHYMNQHPEVLLCAERYKWVHPGSIRPEYFTFERILDYRMRPQGRREETDTPRQYHADLIASKDPARLKWIGDKNPGYVRNLDLLSQNNPEASYILTYRPLEEVAESWEARYKDPEDQWPMGGLETGVDFWNTAMRNTRDFIESAINLNVFILAYRDFYSDQSAIPLLSRFLDIEIGQEIREAWREMSRGFESDRRPKEPLSDEQRAYIEANKDSEAERWVLDRIHKQRWEFEIYSPEASRAQAEERRLSAVRIAQERSEFRRSKKQVEGLKKRSQELEARTRQLEQRARRLEERNLDMARQLKEVRSSRGWLEHRARRLEERNLDLARQLEGVRSSRAWQLLDRTNQLRKKVLRLVVR